MSVTRISDVGGIHSGLRSVLRKFLWAVGDGVPVDGATGAGEANIGAKYVNTATGVSYSNTGSKAVPAWTADQAAGLVSTLGGAAVAVVSDDAVVGGLPVVHLVAIAGGANSNKEITLTHKTRVLEAQVINKAAGTTGSTVTVGNGATAITDVMVTSGADKTVARAATIDDASFEIAAGGKLRVTWASSGGNHPAALVMVTGVRVA